MDQLAPVLAALATKLGVTTQYLWGVLLKQAPIQAGIMAFEYAATAAVIALLYRYRSGICAWAKSQADSGDDFVLFVGTLIFGIASVIWLLACLFCFESFLTAIFNPEYWAFKQVLSAIKSK